LPDTYQQHGVTLATELLLISGVDFDQSDALTQALIGTFLFGLLHAYSMSAGRTPDDAFELAVSVFRKVLHYTPEAAAEGVQHCIEATRPGVHDAMNAIMHRGIDGHQQYVAGDLIGLQGNLKSILAQFGG
jgi:hypothetical protein